MRITSFCAFDNFVRIMASRVSVSYIYIRDVGISYLRCGDEKGGGGGRRTRRGVEVFNAARRQGAEEEVSRS